MIGDNYFVYEMKKKYARFDWFLTSEKKCLVYCDNEQQNHRGIIEFERSRLNQIAP